MKTQDDLIKGIHIVQSNFDYCRNNFIINGTLGLEIKRVMNEWADQVKHESKHLVERFFFVSYNGVNPEDGKTVIGHLAFNSQGYPSMLFITEQLIPERSKVKITDIVITYLHEFATEQDFDEFTVGRNMNDQLGDIIGLN